MAVASYTPQNPESIPSPRELWLPVPGFEGDLEVSNLGRVRGLNYLAPSKRALQPFQLRKGGMRKPYHCAGGYPRIDLKRHGRIYRLHVHRLVALAFVPGHFLGATVDHIDGCRSNNHASNLRWVTRAENTAQQNHDGRGVPKGQRHPGAKLADADIPLIFALRGRGLSQEKIGRRFGVSGSLIHHILAGKRRTAQVTSHLRAQSSASPAPLALASAEPT